MVVLNEFENLTYVFRRVICVIGLVMPFRVSERLPKMFENTVSPERDNPLLSQVSVLAISQISGASFDNLQLIFWMITVS